MPTSQLQYYSLCIVQVFPEQPEFMKTGGSTKQGHFVAHSAAKGRLDSIKHNSVSDTSAFNSYVYYNIIPTQDRHTRVSVVITCDKERDQESQLASS